MSQNLFSKIIIWVTFYFCFQKVFSKSSIDDPLVKNIFSNLNAFLINVAPELFETYVIKKEECRNIFVKVSKDSNEFFYYAFDSGFFYSQIEKEYECINANKSYFFYNYTYLDESGQDISSQYCLFLNKTDYTKSLCLPKECNDFIYYLSNDTTEQSKLGKYLASNNIHNVNLYNNVTKESQNSDYLFKYGKGSIETLLWIVIGYLLIRLLCTIITPIIAKNSEDDEDVEAEEEDQIQTRRREGSSGASQTTIFNQGEERKSLLKEMSKTLSYLESITLLFQTKNKYYDETDIIEVAGLRFFMLYFIIVCQNAWHLLRQPHQPNTLLSTISGFSFVLVRFSVLSFEGIKIINGILLGFKLMSYLKKHGTLDISFKDYFLFYCKSLVYILSFFFFLTIYSFIREIGLFIYPSVKYEYFSTKIIESNECISKPFKVFIPFYFQYFADTSKVYNTSCYRIGLFQMSEFYCFTFIMIITFILIKIRKKLADLLIFLFFWLLICLGYFLSTERKLAKDQLFTIYQAFGPIENISSPHIFVLFYFIGFNIGIIMFYYKDIAQVFNKYSEALSGENNNQYMPFKYNFSIMKFISKQKQWLKTIVMILVIILMVLVSSNFTYMFNTLRKQPSDFVFIGNSYSEATYIYEPILFSILFCILCLCIVLSNNGTIIKDFFNSSVFTPINRIFLSCFSICYFNIMTFHGVSNLNLYLDVKNIAESGLSIFIFSLISSLVHVVVFELIFRAIYRAIFSCVSEEKKDIILGERKDTKTEKKSVM